MTEPAVQDAVEEEALVSEGQMDVVDEPVIEEPVVEPPAVPEPVAVTDSMIENGSFETWGIKAPDGWSTLDVDSSAGVSVIPSVETPYGSRAVGFVPAGEVPSIFQKINLPAEHVGKTMRLSAAINSSEEGMTKVTLYYMLDGSRQAILLKDLGTGEWTVSTAEFELSPDVDPESIEILIGLRDGAQETSYVDDVRLEIVE